MQNIQLPKKKKSIVCKTIRELFLGFDPPCGPECDPGVTYRILIVARVGSIVGRTENLLGLTSKRFGCAALIGHAVYMLQCSSRITASHELTAHVQLDALQQHEQHKQHGRQQAAWTTMASAATISLPALIPARWRHVNEVQLFLVLYFLDAVFRFVAAVAAAL